MSIKSVNRSACAAFAPEAPYLATGTMAGVVDLQFSSSENLDLFELDFASDDQQLILAGSAPSSDRFIRLSWGKPLPNSSEFSLGLVAGGLVDGNIGIWNPKSLIEGGAALLQNLSRHRGPVRGLEFSPSSPNILASGADEEISIWDLANPTEPTHYPPLRGGGEISSLSWNSQVHHILASTSFSGTTVIWDLKKHKSVMSFSDSVRRRCSVLQWSPGESRQLVVASDEDESPSIRLWDLRYLARGPVREFAGHTKGVIAMSWCPIDSSYLLSCAKDNRTICWDTTSGEIVSELPAGTNCNFDVHWYPRIPGVISASSYDGKIGLYNIEGNRQGGGGVAAESFRRPPKWYTRKAGVSFGFGGKLVSFNSSGVFEQKLVTEHNLVSRCSEFEAATKTGEKSCLRLLCEKRSEESESEDEKEIWGFLKVMFNEDGTARTKLLSHLGFSPPVEENNATTETDRIDDGEDFFNNVPDDGEDFFNNLPPSPKTAPGNGIDDFVAVEKVEEDEDQTFDNAVERALVVSDYKGAVAQCISANRIADALVIAHAAGDAMLWESTRDQYLKTSSSRYLKVVAAMVNRDLMSLVNSRPLKSWKETIALVCTFAPEDEWTLLCETLASRLMAAGKTLPASLCFIGAGNIDKAVEIWSRTDAFEDLMEKTIVLALASGQKIFTASLCKLVGKYAEILAGQGLFSTAMEHLKILELSPELAVLQDRIARAMEPDQEIRRSTQISQDKHPLPNTVVQYPSPPHPDQFRQPPLPNIMLPPPISPQPDQSRWRPHSNIFLPYPNPPQPDQFRQSPQPNNILPSPSPPQPDQFRQPPQPNMFLPTPSPPQHDQFRQPPQPIMFMPSPINPPQPPQLRQQPVTPTIQTADTCNVPAQLKPVIATLTRLFRETSEAQPSKKRENDDGSKKLGALFMKLNSGDISRRAAEKLVETCQALDHGDLAKASQLQTQLTATDWDECGAWLPTLKRMIKARQMDFS